MKLLKKGLMLALVLSLIVLVGSSFSKVKATTGVSIPGYTQITNVKDIVSGKTYLIAGVTSSGTYLMNSTQTSKTKPVGTLYSESLNLLDYEFVFTYETNYTITNSKGKDLGFNSTDFTVDGTNDLWNISTGTYGSFRISNKSDSTRCIVWREGTTCKFGSYASSNIKGTEYYDVELYLKNDNIGKLSTPEDLLISSTNVVSFSSVDNASGYVLTLKDGENIIYESNVNSGSILPINKAGNYNAYLKAIGTSYDDSDYAEYSWTCIQGYANKTVSEVKESSDSDYIYYRVSGTILKTNDSYKSLTIANKENIEVTLYLNNINNYDSYDFVAGDDVIVTGYRNSGQLKGIVVLTHNIDYISRCSLEFNKIEIMSSLKVSYDVESTPASYYEKVTKNQLDWSGTYLLVYEDESNSVTWTGVDAVSCNVNVTISNGIIYDKPTGAVELLIENYDTDYSIKVSGGTNNGKYIGGKSDGNGIVFDSNKILNAISFADGCVNIVSNTRKLLYNNAPSNYRFRYFGSAQKSINLYKLVDGNVDTYIPTQSNNKNDVALKFGACISKELYDNIDALEKTITYGIEYQVDGGSVYKKVLEGAWVESEFATESVAEGSGNYFQFVVSLSGIPTTGFDKVITAKAYVCIDGDYYYSQEKAYSVNSICDYYVKNKANDPSVEPYIDALTYFSTYVG